MAGALQEYFQLTKPGIIRGNAITAAAGFFLASNGSVDWLVFIAVLAGLSLVIASGCVFNNYIDRGIDKKMARTKTRALVKGSIPPQNALIYATVLGVAGLAALALFTNLLTAAVALLGFVFYVVIYGIWKRRSVHGTVVGSISGAVPPMVGYCAVSGKIDLAAVLLFIILVCWQMPHFYAIAMYRSKEYKAASIPVLPLVKGMEAAKVYILFYIAAFAIACATLTIASFASYAFLAITTALSAYWFWLGVKGFNTKDDNQWARGMFGFSLVVISLFSVALSVDSFLF